MKFIPEALYKKIIGIMPVVCVDAVININRSVLLLKRLDNPAKGLWWVSGGRVYKGETLEKAIIRNVKRETSLDVKIEKCIGTYNLIFRKGKFGKSCHNVVVCFVVKPNYKKFKIRIDKDHSAFKTIKKLENNLHPYIKTIIKESKVLV